MKDIYDKPAKPLDLSEPRKRPSEEDLSPHTLDLSKQQKKPKQTNFFEYMPLTMSGADQRPDRNSREIHEDDEFGEKLAIWIEDGWLALKAFFLKLGVQISAALKPLRLFWVVVIGAGLILGLLIIAYIATHRSWITSLPSGPLTGGKTANTDNAGSSSNAPGRGGAGALQSPSPSVSPRAAMPGAGAQSGKVMPAVGQTSTSPVQYPAALPVKSAPAPATPAPVLPVAAPAPTPAPVVPLATPAPLLPAPVDGLLSPVKSVL